MAEQSNDEAVPFEIGPNSLPIVGMESIRSEYWTAPQFTPRTLQGDTRTSDRFATTPEYSEDAAANVGRLPVFCKRWTDNQLVVPHDGDGVQEFLEL